MSHKEKEEILFVINPIAGIRKKTYVENIINRHLDPDKFVPMIRYTEYKGHGTKITQKALKSGIRKVVAVGGDGTVNEVASALRDTDAALGIIPLGSGNGLARHLHIPLRTKAAVDILNSAKEIKIDYGVVNGIPFFCTCGVGFDAFVGEQFAEHDERGFITYVRTTLAEYLRYKPKKYKLKIKKTKIKSRAFLVTFANAAQWGNNAYISPHADIQDGYLDICMLAPFPRIRALNIGFRLFNRHIYNCKYLKVLRSNKVVLKRKKPGAVHFDGEPVVMKKTIRIYVVPKGLRVMVPARSSLK